MDVKTVRKAAERQGWTVEHTRNNHFRFVCPTCRRAVTVSGSASDGRAMRNVIADLRKHGFEWQGRKIAHR